MAARESMRGLGWLSGEKSQYGGPWGFSGGIQKFCRRRKWSRQKAERMGEKFRGREQRREGEGFA